MLPVEVMGGDIPILVPIFRGGRGGGHIIPIYIYTYMSMCSYLNNFMSHVFFHVHRYRGLGSLVVDNDVVA